MLKLEKKFFNFLEKNYIILGFIIITFMALMIRFSMFSFESRDYTVFLSKWFNEIKENGGLLALANYPGDYNAPYVTILALLTYLPFSSLYLIKIVSVAFDLGLAISSAALVYHLAPKSKTTLAFFVYTFMLFAPEIAMNGALWGQCDSGYAMFIVLAFLFLFKDKNILSFIMLGIAFALKLQTIFILPIFIIVYIVEKKVSILHFLIIPAVNIVLSLPAIIYGMPLSKVFSVYYEQIGSYDDVLNLNFINLYGLIYNNGSNAVIIKNLAIAWAMIICFLMLIYIVHKKIKLNPQKILNLGLWFAVVMPFVLPKMHDRYLYVGCVMSIIYFVLYRKNLLLLVSVIMASLITYFGYLFGVDLPDKGLFIIMYFFVIVYYTKDVILMLRDDTA